MPGLIFPIATDGLRVPVLIGHDSARLQAFQVAGMPLPTPLHAQGLLDTGTDVTAVGPSLLNTLGLQAAGSVQTQTASGLVIVQFYKVSITLYNPTGPSRVTFFRPVWTVTSLH